MTGKIEWKGARGRQIITFMGNIIKRMGGAFDNMERTAGTKGKKDLD